MPGLEGDLEEWQTQEVNVTRGQKNTLPFLKVTRGPRHYLLFPTVLLFHAHINIHWFSSCEMTDSHTLGLHVNFYDELQK